jgi:hypothetical protein
MRARSAENLRISPLIMEDRKVSKHQRKFPFPRDLLLFALASDAGVISAIVVFTHRDIIELVNGRSIPFLNAALLIAYVVVGSISLIRANRVLLRYDRRLRSWERNPPRQFMWDEDESCP